MTDNATPSVRTAVGQFAVLLGFSLLLFRDTTVATFTAGLTNPEQAHTYGVILLIGLLIYRRGRQWAGELSRGSALGVCLMLLAIGLYFIASWPFNHAIPRRMAIVPLLAGGVLATCGWRVTGRCVPIFLLILLCIPVGSRFYAAIMIRPEEMTLSIVAAALEIVTGALVNQQGPDLYFTGQGVSGIIGLGTSFRGASLFLACASIVVFATYIRERPTWHVLVMAALAAPVIFLCNIVRFFLWGVVTIQAGSAPTSTTPRFIASVAALVCAWLMTIAILTVLDLLTARPAEPSTESPA